MEFKDKIVFISGGASGIGEATAMLFAKEGAIVVIGDNDIVQAKKVVEEIKISLSKKISAYKIDIASKECVDNSIDEIIKEFKKIDILAHCAGVTDIENCDFLKLEEKIWDYIIKVNLKGTFLVCQRVMKEMVKQKYGRIITLGSLAGTIGGLVVGANYSASKAGVIGLTKAMAKYAAPYNITVNCVSPAMIDTNMTRNWSKELIDKQINNIPLKRFGKADEIASAIVYLASEKAAFITGATININGGLFMG